MLSRRSGRPGFTMVEIVVVLFLIAILAAALVPVISNRMRDGQTTAVSQTMDALAQAISAYRADVRRYPTRLQHLTTPPTLGVRDPCGRTVPQAFLDEWRGPYLQAQVTSAGIRVHSATVQDTLKTDPAAFSTTQTGYLLVETTDVDEAVADAVGKAFDADDDAGAGVVQWTETAPGIGTLVYGVRIRGC